MSFGCFFFLNSKKYASLTKSGGIISDDYGNVIELLFEGLMVLFTREKNYKHIVVSCLIGPLACQGDVVLRIFV
jgi:hypothetical protein